MAKELIFKEEARRSKLNAGTLPHELAETLDRIGVRPAK